MPSTRSQMVVDAVIERLQAILVADGFSTDSGQNVNAAEALDPGSQLPGFVVTSVLETYAPVSGSDGVVDGGAASYRVTQEITVASAATATGIKGEAMEAQLGDAKRALCLALPLQDSGGAQLGKLSIVSCEKNPRADGEGLEGFVLTLRCWHIEGWGNPYAIH